MGWLWYEGQKDQCQDVLLIIANLPEIKQYSMKAV